MFPAEACATSEMSGRGVGADSEIAQPMSPQVHTRPPATARLPVSPAHDLECVELGPVDVPEAFTRRSYPRTVNIHPYVVRCEVGT
jgi:hypothetical protein